MTTTKTLKQDAAISILFGNPITGFLFGDDVFIELLNGRPSTVYLLNENAKADVATALYLSEMVTDSLGLNLKDENDSFSRELIEEKILESFETKVFVTDYDVVYEGNEVDIENPFTNDSEDVISDNANVDSVDAEEVLSVSEKFSSALKNLKNSKAVSSVVSKETEEEVKPEIEKEIEKELEANEVTDTTNPAVTNSLAPGVTVLTREEKREISKKILLTLFSDQNKTYLLSDLYTELKELIDFDTSVSSVRNFLLDLVNENKIEVAGRGKFKFASTDQISLFEGNEASNVTDSSLAEAKLPVQEEVANQQKPTTDSINVKQPVTAQVVQTESVPVVEYAVVKEEHKKATIFSSLFSDDDSVRSYLTMLDIPTALAKWAVEYRAYNRERFSVAPQTVVDIIPSDLAYLGNSSVLTKGLAALKSDTPLSLKGPAGTGKTTLIETLAAVLNLPLFSINGSLESNKSTLVGEPTIKQQGVISIKDGQMQKAADFGGILYVDEINMMRPDMLSIVNGFLDHRKTFYNDVRGEMTFAHKDTRFVSAMNVGYSGTKQMNKATSDRKVAIQLSYMSKVEIKKVLTKIIENLEDGKNLSVVEQQMIVEKVTKFYSVVSQKAQNGLVPDLAASTRSIIQLLKHVPILGYQMSLEMIFDKFTEEESAQIKGALLGSGLDEELGVDFSK
jgi:MoxR-like ATPase